VGIFSQLLGSREVIKARAIVVDLANIRVPAKDEDKVLMGNKLQDPFYFQDIKDIMNDVDNLGLHVPVFYLLDTLVTPHDMTESEKADFVDMQASSVFSKSHIWRIGEQFQKADFAICELANNLDAMIFSGDRFRDHISNKTIQRPDDLIQFSPNRANRQNQHQFNKTGGRRKAQPSDFIVRSIDTDEYWANWDAHVRIILKWLNPIAMEWAEIEIKKGFPTDNPLPSTTTGDTNRKAPDSKNPLVLKPTKPKRESEVSQMIMSSDGWGLSQFVDKWVIITGRLFKDENSWVLRDFASAPGVGLINAEKVRGLREAHWTSCEGILRKDNFGYFLESPSWQATTKPVLYKFLYPQFAREKLVKYRSWGNAPWRASNSDTQENDGIYPSVVPEFETQGSFSEETIGISDEDTTQETFEVTDNLQSTMESETVLYNVSSSENDLHDVVPIEVPQEPITTEDLTATETEQAPEDSSIIDAGLAIQFETAPLPIDESVTHTSSDEAEEYPQRDKRDSGYRAIALLTAGAIALAALIAKIVL
jgi:hypothetical protein